MRESIYAVASLWYTAWVNAGQPNLQELTGKTFSDDDIKEFQQMNTAWRNAGGEEHH